jgi:hypothetical protein
MLLSQGRLLDWCEMTLLTDEEYVAAKGLRCITRGCDGIVRLDSTDAEMDTVVAACHCEKCQRYWLETYQLTGYMVDANPVEVAWKIPPCPECGLNDMVQIVKSDGGYECLRCQTETHESWFWPEPDASGWPLTQ